MFWHRNYGFWEKGHAAKSESANNEPLIYNLQGEEISRLVERLQSAGVYSVAWNASNVSTAIYFYRLKQAIRSLRGRLVVLR